MNRNVLYGSFKLTEDEESAVITDGIIKLFIFFCFRPNTSIL